MSEKSHKIISNIHISLFFSGVCWMIYAIVWIRLLYPLMGSPFLSMTTVFAIFIGGLSMGNFLAGRYIDDFSDPLKTYGMLEGALGIYCLFLPWFIHGARPIYAAIYQNIQFSFSSAILLRFLVSTSIFLIPAAFIGATWPVASKLLARRPDHLGRTMGKAYGIFALGGFLGALATGLLFIPYFGAYPTLSLGIMISLLISIFLLRGRPKKPFLGTTTKGRYLKNSFQYDKISRSARNDKVNELSDSLPGFSKEGGNIVSDGSGRDQTDGKRTAKGEKRPGRISTLVLLGYGFSGLAVVMYLFIWLKVLITFAGSFFCALCFILSAFILGLSLGSFSLARFIDKRKDHLLLLGIIELAMGISFLGIIPLLGRFPFFMTLLVKRFASSFLVVQLVEFLFIFLIFLVPSFLTGLTFPLVCRLYTNKTKKIGRSIADLLAMNTFGALMGIVLGSLLIVQFGIIKGSLLAVFSHLFLGTVFLIKSPSFPRLAKGIIFLLMVGAFPFFFLPTRELPFLKTKPCQFTRREDKKIIHTLAKKNDPAHQVLLAYIPLLLHSSPQEILFLGQATTRTLSSIKHYPVREIDFLKISSPETGSSDNFKELCPKVPEDERVKLISEDSRQHLRFSNKKYDVIISQPFKACATARPDLFTIEFFQLCRQRLRPGGIAVNRLTTQNMRTEVFKSILYTWHKVFPFVTLWETNLGHDFLLIGSDQKIQWNYPFIHDRLRKADIASDLARVNIKDPCYDLLSCFFMDEQELPAFCHDSKLFTDDFALTGSFALKLLYKEDLEELLKEMQPYRGKGLSLLLAHIQSRDSDPEGVIEKKIKKRIMAKEILTRALLDLMRKEPRDKTLKELKKAWQLNPDDNRAKTLYLDTLFAIADDYNNQKLFDLAVLSLLEIIKINPDNVKTRFLLGKAYYNKSFIDQAITEFESVLKLKPDHEEAHCQLGIAYLNSGWIDLSIGEFTRAIQLKPDYPEPHLYLGAAYFKKDLLFKAIEEYEKATALNPDYADAHYNLGIAYLKKGLVDEAISEWKKVIKIRPDEVNGRYNLAVAYLNYGEIKESISQLEEILRINPAFTQARSLLTTAYQMRDK